MRKSKQAPSPARGSEENSARRCWLPGPPDDDGDPERLLAWIWLGYEPILRRGRSTITPDYVGRLVRSNVDPTTEWAAQQRRISLPGDYVLLMRTWAGSP